MDYLTAAEQKAGPRRFSGDAITGFGPLMPEDSLVARMEAIWKLRPTVIEFEYGSLDSDTGVGTSIKHRMSRVEAAAEIKWLREHGAYIERRATGYFVEGV